MKLLRCRICGETFLGTEAPSRCPFCGAAAHHFVGPDGFASSENDIALVGTDADDLATAIELERSNTRFYLAMSRMSGSEPLASAYKRLSRIEAEHCSLFCKLLGVPKPADLGEPEGSPSDWCDAIAQSAARETRAAAFYAEVASRAGSERLREVFAAVTDVERDHLDVDTVAADLGGCG